jgi:putative endonuclease
VEVWGSSPHGPTIPYQHGFSLYLQSEKTRRFYIGSSEVLGRRLEEHARGQTASTRGRSPWKLAYQEEYESLLAAHRRELEIKRWKSSKVIQALIQKADG